MFSETEILELNTVVAGQLKILHDSEMEKAKKTEEYEEDGILYVKLMLQPNLEVMKMAKLNIENAFSKFCGESEAYLFSAAILSRPAFQTFELTHWAELASSDTETIVQISSKTGGPQIKSGDYGSAIGFVLSGIQGENSFSQFSSNKDKDLFALRWGYLEPKFAQ